MFIPQEKQDLPHLPSPLEIIVQASQQTHYFAQDDGCIEVAGAKKEKMDFRIFLNMIKSFDEG